MAGATDDSDGVALTGDICGGGFTSCHDFLHSAQQEQEQKGKLVLDAAGPSFTSLDP